MRNPVSKQYSEELILHDRQARKTVLVVSGVLLLISAWNVHKGRMTIVFVFGSIGVALLVFGLLIPPVARGFHRFWMRFASGLGYVNNRIILFLLYYGVFTPYGLISRLLGRDPLNRRCRTRDSYWISREGTRQSKEQFERLF